MMLRLGRPHTALVVAPHPDDEVIGAGKLIRALRQRGTRVSVVVVSDGAASHPNSRRWPPARLIAERRRETRRALRRLGLNAGDVAFLGLPDGRLLQDEDRCRRLMRREMARRGHLQLLIGPAAEDDHPDHRAVAAALGHRRGIARRLAYRVWPALGGNRGRALHLRAGSIALGKRSLIRCHRTQCGAVTDDPDGFSIARHELDAFAHPVERFEALR